MPQFRALVLRQADGGFKAGVEQVGTDALPEGEVLVRVTHSTLNYKDGMILAGQGRLVRTYPHVPGIDFAGVVESSTDPRWTPGQGVVLTGWRVGETRWGGYAELASVKADMLVALPDGMTPRQAMAIGTAGFTSMLAVMALEEHGLVPGAGPGSGDVLVTGAAGGVGSVAVALLSRLGHRVVGSSGRPETHDYLRALGAAEILDRAALAAPPGRPLDAERWAGAIDAVGGTTLATLLSQLRYRASVASVVAAGASLAAGASVTPAASVAAGASVPALLSSSSPPHAATTRVRPAASAVRFPVLRLPDFRPGNRSCAWRIRVVILSPRPRSLSSACRCASTW